MEVMNNAKEGSGVSKTNRSMNNEFLEISTNWRIVNKRVLPDTISTIELKQAHGRTDLEDVVSVDTCIRLEGLDNDKTGPCTVDIKVTNGQNIARIAVVSEALILEFYKQFGEYAITTHAEFVDEFENNAVYFAEVSIVPPSPETSIKFARLKYKGSAMWLYGIRLILTEPAPNSDTKTFDHNVINKFMRNCSRPVPKRAEMAKKLLESFNMETKFSATPVMDSCLQEFIGMSLKAQRKDENDTVPEKGNVDCMGDSLVKTEDNDVRKYIDNKFREMEERLMLRVDAVERTTNEKLDTIIKLLSDNKNSNH